MGPTIVRANGRRSSGSPPIRRRCNEETGPLGVVLVTPVLPEGSSIAGGLRLSSPMSLVR